MFFLSPCCNLQHFMPRLSVHTALCVCFLPCLNICSLYESLICNEYLEDLAPGHLPSSPAAAAAVRLLIDQFGAKVGPAFGKVMFGGGEGEAAAAAGKELDEALRLVTQVTWQ